MSWVHIHLFLNHVPVIGIFGAALVLAVGILRRSQEVMRVGLGLIVLVAAAGVVVYLTGEPAEHLVRRLPGISRAAVEAHEEAAFVATAVLTLVGIGAAAGLLMYRGAARVPQWFAVSALALSVVAAAMMTWNAGLGGQIRHSEIRQESVPPALEQQAHPQPGELEETQGR
jgi:uncharacterized membrane protein